MEKVKKTVRPEFRSPPLHLLTLSRTYPDDVKPLVKAWTMETEESLANPTSASQEAEGVEPATESVVPSEPAPSTRIPRLAPTSVWKKTIGGLISGERKRATRSAPAIVPVDVLAPVPPSSTASLELDPPKKIEKIDWSEDVEKSLFTPGNVALEKTVDTTTSVRDRERVIKTPQAHVFEKCDCSLQDPHFKPESWNKFKIPASCHPSSRPPNHFFAPREADESNPSTRIVVDNVNAFRHHSTEPNMPYVNGDVEDLFYPVGAKNVRCFDGRVVGGIARYNTSYAVVDFETVGDAVDAFKVFQGRKAYPGSYHLRLRFVDVNDPTFGRRMAVSMGPMERSEEERKGFVGFFEDLDTVDVDLTKVVMPSRPGFLLPARPVTPSES